MSIGDYNEPLMNAEWIYEFDLSKVITVSQKDTPVTLLPAESGEEISLHTPQE